MSMHIVFMVSKYSIYVLADFWDQIPLSVSLKHTSNLFPSKLLVSFKIIWRDSPVKEAIIWRDCPVNEAIIWRDCPVK